MKSKTSPKKFLIILLAFLTSIGNANADFTFGEPTNMGATVNSAYRENQPSISIDRLSLYFGSNRPGTSGERDIWVTTRATIDDDWGTPVNLGPPVNSPFFDSNPYISPDGLEFYFISKSRPGGFGYDDIWVSSRVSSREGKDVVWSDPVNIGSSINTWAADYGPKLSADGLELYFNSTGHGGFGGNDIFVVKRATVTDDWGAPVNLGPVVNGPFHDVHPTISTDGLCLIFSEHGSAGPYRPGGFGGADIWMTIRPTPEVDWGPPVNLGPTVNSSSVDNTPYISPDGSILYFSSSRPGGFGDRDLWQVSIEPVVDFNGDGIVDSADMCIMVDHWGEDYSLCDIGPTPFGDGIVDVEDLIVLAEHLFEEFPPVE